jgi:hypothetical protein
VLDERADGGCAGALTPAAVSAVLANEGLRNWRPWSRGPHSARSSRSAVSDDRFVCVQRKIV